MSGGQAKCGRNTPTWGALWLQGSWSFWGGHGALGVRWVRKVRMSPHSHPPTPQRFLYTEAPTCLYRHVTTSVCVGITRYSAARRTSWTPYGWLLRGLYTGPGGSRRRGTVRVRRTGWLDLITISCLISWDILKRIGVYVGNYFCSFCAFEYTYFSQTLLLL